jgi:hypothetical protein
MQGKQGDFDLVVKTLKILTTKFLPTQTAILKQEKTA